MPAGRPAMVLALVLLLPSLLLAPPAHAQSSGEGHFVLALDSIPDDLQEGQQYAGAVVLAIDRDLGIILVDREPMDTGQNVRYIEPEGEMRAAFVPDDPYYAYQPGLRNINLPAAWDRETGAPAVKLCIVDSGIRLSHEDFDVSRYAGGWDFVEGDATPQDEEGHGTHVASIAISSLGNGIGIAGVAQTSYLVARVLDEEGRGSTLWVASGVKWCANQGAAIIGLSLGSPESSSLLSDAVGYARSKGALMVAAAGNDACEDCVLYPARDPRVLAVGCTTSSRAACAFGSYGPEVDISAPGQNILAASASGDAAYVAMSGTSMSTPHVAGVAALLKSSEPTLSAAQLHARLVGSARDLGPPGRDDAFGAGEVDAAAAILVDGDVTLRLRNRVADVPRYSIVFQGAEGDAVAVCDVDAVAQDMLCEGATSPSYPVVRLPVGVYSFEASADTMRDLAGRNVKVSGERMARVDLSFVTRMATLRMGSMPATVGEYTLTLAPPEGEPTVCTFVVVERAHECAGDDAAPLEWPSLKVPEGTYVVTTESSDGLHSNDTRSLRLIGGKTTVLMPKLRLDGTAMKVVMPKKGPSVFTMDFHAGGVAGSCLVDGAAKTMACEGDATAGAWPHVLLPVAGAYLVRAEADEDHAPFVKENVRLKLRGVTSLSVTLRENFARLDVRVANKDLDVYQMDVVGADGRLVDRCIVDRREAEAECEAGLVRLLESSGAIDRFRAPASEGERWALHFRPWGEQEGGAADVTRAASPFVAAKTLSATINFRVNTLLVRVTGGQAATADIVVTPVSGAAQASADRASATFRWVPAGEAEIIAVDDAGNVATATHTLRAGSNTVRLTLKAPEG